MCTEMASIIWRFQFHARDNEYCFAFPIVWPYDYVSYSTSMEISHLAYVHEALINWLHMLDMFQV